MPTDIEKVTDALSKVNEVESVYVVNRSSAHKIFAVLEEDCPEAANRIYDIETCLVEALPNIELEFKILARNGRSLEALFGSQPAAWSRSSKAEAVPQ